jgi:hypothetical protein
MRRTVAYLLPGVDSAGFARGVPPNDSNPEMGS